MPSDEMIERLKAHDGPTLTFFFLKNGSKFRLHSHYTNVPEGAEMYYALTGAETMFKDYLELTGKMIVEGEGKKLVDREKAAIERLLKAIQNFELDMINRFN